MKLEDMIQKLCGKVSPCNPDKVCVQPEGHLGDCCSGHDNEN